MPARLTALESGQVAALRSRGCLEHALGGRSWVDSSGNDGPSADLGEGLDEARHDVAASTFLAESADPSEVLKLLAVDVDCSEGAPLELMTPITLREIRHPLLKPMQARLKTLLRAPA